MQRWIKFLIANGYIDSLAWLLALGSFLLAYIRIVKSHYYTPLQDATDVLHGIRYKFDIIKPLIIFLISMAWIITHLG